MTNRQGIQFHSFCTALTQVEDALKSKNKEQRKKAKKALKKMETIEDVIILTEGLQGLFRCERCGKCCTEVHFLYLNDEDITRMAEFLKISNQDFIGKYTKDGDDSQYSLQIPCPFYDETTKSCTIYEARPTSCVGWPSSSVEAAAFQGNAIDWEHKELTIAPPACCLPFASKVICVDIMERQGHFRFMKTKELPYVEKMQFYLRATQIMDNLVEEDFVISDDQMESWAMMRLIAFFDLILKGWSIVYDISQPFAYLQLQLLEGVEAGKKEYKRLSTIRDRINNGEIDLKTAMEFL